MIQLQREETTKVLIKTIPGTQSEAFSWKGFKKFSRSARDPSRRFYRQTIILSPQGLSWLWRKQKLGIWILFQASMLARIDPPQTKLKNENNYIKHSFNMVFTACDEALGLLMLDNKLEIWKWQFEVKQKDQKMGQNTKRNTSTYSRNVHQDG